MKQNITVRQKLEALDSQIIPLIEEGIFHEGEIHMEHVDFYLVIRNQGTADFNNEFYVGLAGQSEFFEEECCVDVDCNADELVVWIQEFRSNPYQFAETYGD